MSKTPATSTLPTPPTGADGADSSADLSGADVDFLLTDQAQAVLGRLAEEDLGADRTLALLMMLRRDLLPHQAGLLLSQARLRKRASAKFPNAHQLFFVEEALEQATAWAVARHHADWIDRHASPGPVLDLGCGIGGDTLALAQKRPVIAYDLAPDRLRLAQANHAAGGQRLHPATFVGADWTAHLAQGILPQAAAAFVDPARRVQGRRTFSLHAMTPPLSAVLALAQRMPALGVKVAPGVADHEIPHHAAVEFISHRGVCKEAVLWFGPLADAAPARRWASVHLGEGEDNWLAIPWREEAPPLGELPTPAQLGHVWLHEPDPAVIRSGALTELCQRLDAHLFDDQIAYLIGPAGRTHPLVQSFRLLEVHTFSLKLLTRRLHALGLGRLEIKKRGSPIDPEQFRRKIKPADTDRPGVVILTRQGDRRLMFLAERPQSSEWEE